MLLPAVGGLILGFRTLPIHAWPALLVGPSLFVTAPLVYWQGDRVIFIGVLLLLPFAGLGIRRVLAGFRSGLPGGAQN